MSEMPKIEVASLTHEQARQHGYNACAILMHAFRELARADDTTRAECYEHFHRTDQLAMECAHALTEHHPTVAETIQNARFAASMAGMEMSPAAIALSRARTGNGAKTYIARNLDTGLVKIGRSVDPERRMTQLQTGAGSVPVLLLVEEGDTERALHKKFQHLRTFGEWFRDDGSIAEYVQSKKESACSK